MIDQLKIGLISPTGGWEGDYYRFESASNGKARVYFAVSRTAQINGDDHNPDALRMTANVHWIADAANRLAALPIDVISWACTSGSFINGRAFAEQQAAELAVMINRKVSSTSLAFIAAARLLGLENVSVLAPYPKDVSMKFQRFLEEYDICVTHLEFMDNKSGWNSAETGYDRICQFAHKAIVTGSQALLIPDTALPSFDWLSDLENELKCPVLTANSVTLWHAQVVAGRTIGVEGLGQLLKTPPGK